MESLVAFVIIIAINIITKSVQDKKKIEKFIHDDDSTIVEIELRDLKEVL